MNLTLRDMGPDPARPRAKESGLTLIEVAITMSTLVGAMVILLSTVVSGEAMSTTNKERHRALEDVSALMEQIETMPLTTISATFQHNVDITQFNNLHVKNQRVRVVYENGASTANPLNFSVVCTWTSATGALQRITVHGSRAR